MKRIFSLLVIAFLCISLSSCKKINEPKIKGNLQEYARVVDYITTVRDSYDELMPKDNQWYNIDMESYAIIVNQDEIENMEMSMKVSGKVLNAEYAFDSKGKFKYAIEMKGTVFATEDKSETYKLSVKYDMDMKFIEGKSFCKITIKGKVDKNKFEYTLKTNMNQLEDDFELLYLQLRDIIDDSVLEQVMNIDIFSGIISSFSTLALINELENALDDDLKNIYIRKNNVTIEDRHYTEKNNYTEQIVYIKNFELSNNNFQLKNLNEYYHIYEEDEESLYKLTTSTSVKQALSGSVKIPNNELEYGF